MIILQISKGSSQWLLRFKGLKKLCRKTLQCDVNADADNRCQGDNNSSLYFCSSKLKT